ncbi:MAG: efflux RND transporter periplasmic adaptor subunit [Sneathiella sp.]
MKPAIFGYFAFTLGIVGVFLSPTPALSQSATSKTTPPAVLVAKVRAEEIGEQFSYFGRVEARERVQIRARIEGYLGPLAFEQGSFVQKGDPLFEIEKEIYEADVALAKANLANARAVAKLAKVDLERSKELRGRNVVSQAQLDENAAKYDEALADVDANKANLNLAEINLGYTEIKAPISGRIGKAAETEGSLVGPSGDPLALLVSQDPMQVAWPVPDRHFTHLTSEGKGADSVVVKLRLADDTVYSFPGKIIYAEPSANSATNTVTVRAEFENPKFRLVDQMLVTVLIEKKQKDERLVMPQDALLLDQQGPYVYAVDEKDIVEIRRIKTGEQRGLNLIIDEGLKAGDRVIVSGLQKVRKGMQVTPKLADSAEGN